MRVSFHLGLNNETVREITATEPLCVEPTTTVRATLLEMKRLGRGAALICQDGKLVGIFTERDALKLMACSAEIDVPIATVMTKNPQAVHVADTIGTAIICMSKGGYRHLPVVDAAGAPCGTVRVKSILHFLVEHFPSVVYTLPPSPHQATADREGA